VSTLTRPPAESLRPVASFAVVRLLLAAGAVAGCAILGFPHGGTLAAVVGGVAVPWSLAVLWLARRAPAAALTPLIATGDIVVLAVIQAAVPATYGPVRFIALLFIAAHAHFQGQRRGVLIATGACVALIGVTVLRDGPLDNQALTFYEAIFAVAALGTAAVIGELRGIETAGRLRARELSRRTIVGEDEVRRHVADFIHDGPVQELIGLDLLLNGAAAAAERGDTARVRQLIYDARQIAENNMHALRDEIVNLGPYAFEELSFEIAVERCIPVWLRRFSCEVEVDADVQLEPQVANDFFRITQEAVANACKHGEAKKVRVTLERSGAFADLRIVDNGKGFGDIAPLGPHEPGHIGLASMRERAELLQGSLDITTQPGRTEVQVRVPIGGMRRRNRR
jgi:signal transduction histidine kinase